MYEDWQTPPKDNNKMSLEYKTKILSVEDYQVIESNASYATDVGEGCSQLIA